ncbi:MAG: hypothetical protein A2017_22185 [Lentisphaerae bacterium GWF2_44_16]|nr:MAG: hypothetical protein A2017_22185 [Lentisphaerae bacterium GWF2_44_16]
MYYFPYEHCIIYPKRNFGKGFGANKSGRNFSAAVYERLAVLVYDCNMCYSSIQGKIHWGFI